MCLSLNTQWHLATHSLYYNPLIVNLPYYILEELWVKKTKCILSKLP